jgi:hypothetical protein
MFIHPYICSHGSCPKLKAYTTNSNKFRFKVCRNFQSYTTPHTHTHTHTHSVDFTMLSGSRYTGSSAER